MFQNKSNYDFNLEQVIVNLLIKCSLKLQVDRKEIEIEIKEKEPSEQKIFLWNKSMKKPMIIVTLNNNNLRDKNQVSRVASFQTTYMKIS